MITTMEEYYKEIMYNVIFEKSSGRLWNTTSTGQKIYFYSVERNEFHKVNHFWLFKDQYKEQLVSGEMVKVKFMVNKK